MKRKSITKILVISLLVFVIAIGLVGCGKVKHKHKFSDWTVQTAPTTNSEGTLIKTCTCGEKQTKVLPKLNDTDYDVFTETPTSCDVPRKKTYTFKEMPKFKFTVEIPAGHTPTVQNVIPATYTTNEVRECTCSVCGKTYTEEIPNTMRDLKYFYDKNIDKLISSPIESYIQGTIDDVDDSSFNVNPENAKQEIEIAKQQIKNYKHEVLFIKYSISDDKFLSIIAIEDNGKKTFETYFNGGKWLGNFYIFERDPDFKYYDFLEDTFETENFTYNKAQDTLINVKNPVNFDITDKILHIQGNLLEERKVQSVTINGNASGFTNYFEISDNILYNRKKDSYSGEYIKDECIYVLANTKLPNDLYGDIQYAPTVDWVIASENYYPNISSPIVFSLATLDSKNIAYFSNNIYIYSEIDPNTILDTKGKLNFWHYDSDNTTPIKWQIINNFGDWVNDFGASNTFDGYRHRFDPKYNIIEFDKIPNSNSTKHTAQKFYTTAPSKNNTTTVDEIYNSIINANSLEVNIALSLFGTKQNITSTILPYMVYNKSDDNTSNILYYGKDKLYEIEIENGVCTYKGKNYGPSSNQEISRKSRVHANFKGLVSLEDIFKKQCTFTYDGSKYVITDKKTSTAMGSMTVTPKEIVLNINDGELLDITYKFAKLNATLDTPDITINATKENASYDITYDFEPIDNISSTSTTYTEGGSLYLTTKTEDQQDIVWYTDKERTIVFDSAEYVKNPYDITLYGKVK